MRRRELEPWDGPPLPPPPVCPLPPVRKYPPPSKEFGDFEFAIYDIVRRLCEAKDKPAQPNGIFVAAVLEDLFPEFENHAESEFKVHSALKWLCHKGFIRKAQFRDGYVVRVDLLTAIASRL